MKKKTILIAALAGVLLLGAGGGAAWWQMKRKAAAEAELEAEQAEPAGADAKHAKKGDKKAAKKAEDKTEYKYVTLDKVIVMLRNGGGEPMSHYLAVDLVFKSSAEQEKMTKEHLPLLRSVVVKRLSSHTLESAGKLTIEELTEEINEACTKNYEEEGHEKPFAVAMIGKLIIE